MARIVIAGCGYVGGTLATALLRDGHEVFGLRRRVERLPAGVAPLQADLARRDGDLLLPEGLDYAIYSVSPDGPSQGAYRRAYLDGLERFLRTLRDQGEKPRRVLFTSSTSVYAQERGEWVDEDSPTRPTRAAGETLLLAERLLLASEFPATVLRLGGIYGPGRHRLIERVAAGEARLDAEPHFTNRIHRDDAAGILRHLLRIDVPARVYLGVDRDPADEADVLRFIAHELQVPPPPVRGPDDPSPQRRAGSKRCRSDRIRSDGYAFRFPSYRDGYPGVIRDYRAPRAADPRP